MPRSAPRGSPYLLLVVTITVVAGFGYWLGVAGTACGAPGYYVPRGLPAAAVGLVAASIGLVPGYLVGRVVRRLRRARPDP